MSGSTTKGKCGCFPAQLRRLVVLTRKMPSASRSRRRHRRATPLHQGGRRRVQCSPHLTAPVLRHLARRAATIGGEGVLASATLHQVHQISRRCANSHTSRRHRFHWLRSATLQDGPLRACRIVRSRQEPRGRDGLATGSGGTQDQTQADRRSRNRLCPLRSNIGGRVDPDLQWRALTHAAQYEIGASPQRPVLRRSRYIAWN